MPKVNPQFYTTHGPITEPGEFSALLSATPGDAESAVKVVQGLLVHIFWAERYGQNPSPEQKQHVQTRHVSKILRTIQDIQPGPLTDTREMNKRFFGNCRDFSALATAILRQHGVPARARCGFGTYFWPEERYEDHWVFEYHDGERWVRADAQMDELQTRVLHLGFDPMDMPPGTFLSAAQAWLLCRAGERDPEKFGIFDMHGMWFIRGNLLRELASLNKLEMLPWDVWGLMNTKTEDLTLEDCALLDEVARMIMADDARLHQLYGADPRFLVPEPLTRG